MKILMGFTGGMDSSLLAWQITRKPPYDLTLLFLDFRSFEGHPINAIYHQDAELAVARRVVAWFKEQGHNLELLVQTPSEILDGEWATPTLIRHAAKMMADYDVFYTGRSVENTRAGRGVVWKGWYLDIFEKVAGSALKLQFPLLEQGKSRAHAFAELPASLLPLTISCVAPTLDGDTVTECGGCSKCRMGKETAQMLLAGMTADDVCDFHLRKRAAGQYAGIETPDLSYGKPAQVPGFAPPDEWSVK